MSSKSPNSQDPLRSAVEARRIIVGGRVQGVGFRPFVYRLAQALGLRGWVQNQLGQVELHVEGHESSVQELPRRLLAEAPPLARPRILLSEPATWTDHSGFEIRSSVRDSNARIHVPPDQFTCGDCLRELKDPGDRRFRYPFINCTQCGPRYTLICSMPYDRANTTMQRFPLCPACAREYEDPADRRFHAEPVACPACGPQLQFSDSAGLARAAGEPALQATLEALRAGAVVAVRGIGGYHLMCDATETTAVERLRRRKPRPHKPLAVMVPQGDDDPLAFAQRYVWLDAATREALSDPARPIVLAPVRGEQAWTQAIAPGLREMGVMLPYSPLHHLLLDAWQGPLVATSANRSGEPVLTESAAVHARLGHVAEAFLDHDRPIARPADDPVLRVIEDRARPIRLGRGIAPVELALPTPVHEPLLATGGHMKNTVALAWGDRIAVSPHIGDLEAPRSLEVFEQTLVDLQQLYGVRARAVVCDGHSGYASSRWAQASGLPVRRVWHHHAHAAGLAGEYPHEPCWLVFTWDGVGLGPDGNLWGGEGLLGRPGAWQRVASLRPFRLPGADKAGRQPWRSALALCWEAERPWSCPQAEPILYEAWRKGLNAPASTAVGRLFDAAAAITGVTSEASFEGQGPMWLEAAAGECQDPGLALTSAADSEGVLRLDWEPLLDVLMDDHRSIAQRAACLHSTLARALVEQARALASAHGEFAVGLTGGVFQNRRLAEETLARLREAGFRAYLPSVMPCNDGGLSFGQAIEAAARQGSDDGQRQ